MFENPRRGRQARNFATTVTKILDIKSSSEQIFFRKLSLGAPVFHTLPRANYNNCNSVSLPCSIIHLLRQVKLIGKSGELHWEDYQLKTTLLLIVGTDA